MEVGKRSNARKVAHEIHLQHSWHRVNPIKCFCTGTSALYSLLSDSQYKCSVGQKRSGLWEFMVL